VFTALSSGNLPNAGATESILQKTLMFETYEIFGKMDWQKKFR